MSLSRHIPSLCWFMQVRKSIDALGGVETIYRDQAKVRALARLIQSDGGDLQAELQAIMSADTAQADSGQLLDRGLGARQASTLARFFCCCCLSSKPDFHLINDRGGESDDGNESGTGAGGLGPRRRTKLGFRRKSTSDSARVDLEKPLFRSQSQRL